jgi:hypothetical protein
MYRFVTNAWPMADKIANGDIPATSPVAKPAVRTTNKGLKRSNSPAITMTTPISLIKILPSFAVVQISAATTSLVGSHYFMFHTLSPTPA